MEQWKEIFAGYLVSSLGNVDSLRRGSRHRLKLTVGSRGYLKVGISVDSVSKTFNVHRLVAQVFIPNPLNKPEVNHINGIKTDNRVENLEWVTRLENQQHACANGLSKTGEEAPRAKLTNKQAEYIRENPDELTTYELAEKFGLAAWNISEVQLGRTYKNAGGKIREPYLHPTNRIPDDIREQIRAEYKPHTRGHGPTVLAKKYGFGRTTIKQIIKEK